MVHSPSMPAWLKALQNPALYDHAVTHFQCIETHISWVLLTGPYAYKFKKPLNLGFLDFSTLEKRHHFCLEELRLNGRLAPQLYLDVVAITGDLESPHINGSDEPFEYGVKMRQFPQENRLDHVLERGELTRDHIDKLAIRVAEFHDNAARAAPSDGFGTAIQVHQPTMENFQQLRSYPLEPADVETLGTLERWFADIYQQKQQLLDARLQNGFIRECHGDMHLGNMVLLEDDVVIFDGIEFNPELYWIDTCNEIAFVFMDLMARQQNDLAYRFINRYLEYSGDVEGLTLLPYYSAYRAMVRAKVAAIRLAQTGLTDKERQEVKQQIHQYLTLAKRYTVTPTPRLLITHGFSGSGKTYLTQHLLECTGAIRLRSDVERKRLYGLAPQEDSHSALAAGIYTKQAGEQTYARLLKLAEHLLENGYFVIVDATFLKQQQRQPFQELAQRKNIPFTILDIKADKEIMEQRLKARQAAGSDASEADYKVLQQQQQTADSFLKGEIPYVIEVQSNSQDITAIADRIQLTLNPHKINL